VSPYLQRRSMRHREQWPPEGDGAGEIRARPADDARRRCRRPRPADRLACQHQVNPDPAEMAAPYGAETTVLDWARAAGLFPLRQPAGRYISEQGQVARVKCARSPLLPPRIMSPQTVHCSSLVVAPTEGGRSGPQCLSSAPPVQGRGRLMGEGSRRPIDGAERTGNLHHDPGRNFCQ